MVRIVKPRYPWKTLAGLVVVIVAALSLPAMWHISRREPQEALPRVRTLTDVELTWKCDAGHTFRAAGQVEPRRCWSCDREAYPVTHYVCPVHGSFEVFVRFAVGEDGVPRTSELRLPGRDWVSVQQGLTCPRCSRQLTYQSPDLVGDVMRRKGRRPGG